MQIFLTHVVGYIENIILEWQSKSRVVSWQCHFNTKVESTVHDHMLQRTPQKDKACSPRTQAPWHVTMWTKIENDEHTVCNF